MSDTLATAALINLTFAKYMGLYLAVPSVWKLLSCVLTGCFLPSTQTFPEGNFPLAQPEALPAAPLYSLLPLLELSQFTYWSAH